MAKVRRPTPPYLYVSLSQFTLLLPPNDRPVSLQYRTNRDIVLATLRELNIDQHASPADGAFYVYVDLAAHGVTDSMTLSRRLLEEAGTVQAPI